MVGNWEGFGETGDYKTMKFGSGAHCWNAGARTLTVTLSCAKENRILGVEEPEVCKYAMRLETPAACYDEDAAAARADLRLSRHPRTMNCRLVGHFPPVLALARRAVITVRFDSIDGSDAGVERDVVSDARIWYLWEQLV